LGKAPDESVMVFCSGCLLCCKWSGTHVAPSLPVLTATAEQLLLNTTPSSPQLLQSCCSAMDDQDFVDQVRPIYCCAAYSFAEYWLM
jgi:hypothetical protein